MPEAQELFLRTITVEQIVDKDLSCQPGERQQLFIDVMCEFIIDSIKIKNNQRLEDVSIESAKNLADFLEAEGCALITVSDERIEIDIRKGINFGFNVFLVRFPARLLH